MGKLQTLDYEDVLYLGAGWGGRKHLASEAVPQ